MAAIVLTYSVKMAPNWRDAMFQELPWLISLLGCMTRTQIGLPCCGLDATKEVIDALQSRVPKTSIDVAWAFDVDPSLSPAFHKHGPYTLGPGGT